MKKIFFLVLAMISFAAITSCQSNQKETTEGDSTQKVANKDSITANQNTSTAVTTDAKNEAPKFSSEEVNEGFAKFEPLKQEYIEAIKSKDAARIKAVNDKYMEWVKAAAYWGNKLTKEESKIHTDYYVKLVNEWDLLTPKTKK